MRIGFYTHKNHLEIDGSVRGYRSFGRRVLVIWHSIPLGLLLIQYSFKTSWMVVLFNMKIFITTDWGKKV